MPTKAKPRIYAAIPLMDELEQLPGLIADISAQDHTDYEVHCCVNQPDHWWDDPQKREVCLHNGITIKELEESCMVKVVIDRSSRGMGWQGKQHGVGWARRVVMDSCNEAAESGDIILSMDADTRYSPSYFTSIAATLAGQNKAVAVSVPYYHRLTGTETADRAMLRYEIYMRYYCINMWRISNPYCFTALGSAIAVPVWAYRKIRGITPNKSGEDFYFLQKLCKAGEMLHWNPVTVYPSARFSGRVFFGTGPALTRGASGDWSSYPLYPPGLFDKVKETYALFPGLSGKEIQTPMDDFLKTVFNEEDIWAPLRKNHVRQPGFVKACMEKVDGLRILQFLKQSHTTGNSRDEEILSDYFIRYHPDKEGKAGFPEAGFQFDRISIPDLNKTRDLLRDIEEEYRLSHYTNFAG